MAESGQVSPGVVLGDDELHFRRAKAWQPEEVARQLAGVRTLWYVAAGWVLDLFRGAQTRPHGDLETRCAAVVQVAICQSGGTWHEQLWPKYSTYIELGGQRAQRMNCGRVGDLGLTVDERDAEAVNYELLVDRADELRAPPPAGGVVARPISP